MNIAVEQLIDVTRNVCQTMLGFELSRSTIEHFSGNLMAATVAITGERNAVVEVATCPDAGRSLASVMFSVDAKDVADEEISDAVSEVVNIIGGNIKGIIGGECSLSIPCFTDNRNWVSPEDAERVAFNIGDGVMHVSFKSTELNCETTKS